MNKIVDFKEYQETLKCMVENLAEKKIRNNVLKHHNDYVQYGNAGRGCFHYCGWTVKDRLVRNYKNNPIRFLSQIVATIVFNDNDSFISSMLEDDRIVNAIKNHGSINKIVEYRMNIINSNVAEFNRQKDEIKNNKERQVDFYNKEENRREVELGDIEVGNKILVENSIWTDPKDKWEEKTISASITVKAGKDELATINLTELPDFIKEEILKAIAKKNAITPYFAGIKNNFQD